MSAAGGSDEKSPRLQATRWNEPGSTPRTEASWIEWPARPKFLKTADEPSTPSTPASRVGMSTPSCSEARRSAPTA